MKKIKKLVALATAAVITFALCACGSSADTNKEEAEIDRLVYQLYGLTEDEIKIVEGK